MEKYTNALVNESSLYLQQHAHNPVNWVAWSADAFEQARQENKLVLVSVGYSACHWCHVMEHECFEDDEVATLMNKHFVCIKVDREERPDVDQVYMTAVQLMTKRGGWPLNCFTLPDGRPIYGGTYFPKEQWMHVLRSLWQTFEKEPEKVEEYAVQLTEGVANSELIDAAQQLSDLDPDQLHELVRRWEPRMDSVEGGPTHAPKFPLPNNYLFLLHYGHANNNSRILQHVKLTLEKMAFGGIYDQLGGGFARYSVDMIWKVPHFEKMLYDNGQLLSLYAQAYHYDAQPEYKRVLDQTLEWLEREMSSPEGGIYAAQDADSEGVEGKYYVWTPDAIKTVLGKDADWYVKLYNPHNKGYWEEDHWILLRNASWEDFCKVHPEVTPERIQWCNELLMAERRHRIAPGTDTKCLTSWNALAITGLVDSYIATADDAFLRMALKAGKWLVDYQMTSESRLWRSRQNGKSFIEGFLDDYAFTIEAFTKLYSATADQIWLEKSLNLLATVMQHFRDPKSGMYYFTSDANQLIARKMELQDNVIPSTNSAMAHNLLTLGLIEEQPEWEMQARQLLQNLRDGMEQYGSGYSNWALLLQRFLNKRYVLHVHGTTSAEQRIEINRLLSPQVVVKYLPDGEKGYVLCGDEMCWPRVESLEEVRGQMV